MRVVYFISYSQANHSLRFLEFANELSSQLKDRLVWTSDDIDLDNYFPSEFLASALDPRTKELTFLSEENQSEVLITPTCMSHSHPPLISHQVWEKLSELVESLGSDSIGDSASSLSYQRASTRGNPAEFSSSLSVIQLVRNKTMRARQGRAVSEVDLFRKVEGIDIQCDPYEWWKLHEGTFPRVATLAKVLLFFIVSIR